MQGRQRSKLLVHHWCCSPSATWAAVNCFVCKMANTEAEPHAITSSIQRKRFSMPPLCCHEVYIRASNRREDCIIPYSFVIWGLQIQKKMVGLLPMPKYSYHVRPTSLPSGSHPVSLGVEEKLHELRGWETSSSSTHYNTQMLRDGLDGLRVLYDCVEDLLQSPQTQNAIAHNEHEKCVKWGVGRISWSAGYMWCHKECLHADEGKCDGSSLFSSPKERCRKGFLLQSYH